MTRKRFVKLVMSCGYSRNYANACAKGLMVSYGSYQEAWNNMTIFQVKRICNSIKNMFIGIAKVIVPMIKETYENIKAIMPKIDDEVSTVEMEDV